MGKTVGPCAGLGRSRSRDRINQIAQKARAAQAALIITSGFFNEQG
jgi:hypothetical protein